MQLLVVDCCVREEESRTRRWYEGYLQTLPQQTQVEKLFLTREAVAPLTAETLAERDRLLAAGETQDPRFRFARQFREADEILIAAPYWDLSFPALLKAYLEQVSVCGITFAYVGADCVGLCKARRLLYFSTCGGFVGPQHLGAAYVRGLAAMFGIPETVEYTLEGLDIDPSRADALLEAAIAGLSGER